MTFRGRCASPFLLLVYLLAAAPSPAQEPAPPPAATAPAPSTPAPSAPAPGAPVPQAQAPAPPPEPGSAEGGELPPKPIEDRLLPRLDIYFPEGDLDLRINRLINKTFFEGQFKYNFINGDITAFLRYRY